MLADSHCHLDCLDLTPYNGDIKQAIAAARAKNVQYILCPGVDIENFPRILEIVQNDSDLFAAVGLHPTEKKSRDTSLSELLTLGQHKKVVGIGETGLDYFYAENAERIERQKELFKMHIQAAKELNKPLIIHTRDAEADTVKLLIEEGATNTSSVIHCFTGSSDFAVKALELGFYISFSGIITFKNAENLRQIAKQVPLDRMLIETDAPYLAPVPMRGKPNEPAYLPYLAEFMANLLDLPYESFTEQMTQNFLRFCKV